MDGSADRGPAVEGVTIQFIILAVGSFALRAYVRVHMVRAWGWDDWMMATATCTFVLFMFNVLAGVHYGVGRHQADLSTDDVLLALKFWLFCYIWYSWTMILSKLSIAIFLLRIVVTRTSRWILYCTMFVNAATGITFFFAMLLQCLPVTYFWERMAGPGHAAHGEGSCMPVDFIINVTFAYSALNILSDFTLALLPITIVWGLHMPFRMKLATVPLLSMGCIASAGVVVRLGYVQKYRDEDFLYATVEILIWSIVEAGLAITAGSLACVRPLFKVVLHRLGLTASEPFPAQSSHYILRDGSTPNGAGTRRSARSRRATTTTAHTGDSRKGGAAGAGDCEMGLGLSDDADGLHGKDGDMIPMRDIGSGVLTTPSPIVVTVEQGLQGVSDAETPEESRARARANSSHAGVVPYGRGEPPVHYI